MASRKITLTDIVFGEPLPWDLYIASDRLLLRKGHVLVSSVQFKRLLDSGLFADIDDDEGDSENGETAGADAPPANLSVLREINSANKRLEKLLHVLKLETSAHEAIIDIAKELVVAVEIDADIALASIFLNQIGGGYAVRHCIEAAVITVLVARAMHKSNDEILTIAAATLTMNVGMLHSHEAWQSKRTTLSHDELAHIHRHPEESVYMLKQAGIVDDAWLSYVLAHHESADGSGYPYGSNGEEIPQNAKLISLADRYCAHVSARNYRKSVLPDLALRDILLSDKVGNDPELAGYFVALLGSYPPGAYVRLKNGEICIVLRRGKTDLTPLVKAIMAADGTACEHPIQRDTSQDSFEIECVLHEDDVGIHCSMREIWGEKAAL